MKPWRGFKRSWSTRPHLEDTRSWKTSATAASPASGSPRTRTNGYLNYKALLERDLAHPIESVGKRLRARMSWLNQAPSDKAA
jgi:ketol-acid reductoisomerase